MGNPSTQHNTIFIYFLSYFAAVGIFFFGYDSGIVSGSIILLRKDFNLSKRWIEAIVSGTIGAAALASLFAGYLNDLLGRRKLILIGSFTYTVGATVMAASVDKYMLLVGRLIVGTAVGLMAVTIPVYIAEAAPPDIRGRLVSSNQLFMTSGVIIASLLAGAFSSNKEHGWRYMFGIGAIPSTIQFIGFWKLPESPRWLVQKGRIREAERVLVRIRRRQASDIKEEMTDIETKVEKDRKESEISGGFALKKILTTPHVRKALFIACGLQAFQQLCGVNTVIYYSASILQMAGYPDDQAIWWVCVPNAMIFICTFIGVFFVEKWGRKSILIASMTGVMLSCIVLAVGFQLQLQRTPSINSTLQLENYPVNVRNDSCYNHTICDSCVSDGCGFCFIKGEEKTNGGACMSVDSKADESGSTYGQCHNATTRNDYGVTWTSNYCPTNVAWVSIFGLALYMMTFPPGVGPMPWTITSEVFPLWARGTGVALAAGTNWTSNLIVSFTFLTLSDAITKYGMFYLFAGISLLGITFFIVFVPETKNKTLEQVEMLFMTEERRTQAAAAKYGCDNEAVDTKL